MDKCRMQIVIFPLVMILFISIPENADALKITATLYEDIKESDLVVAGEIIHETTNESLKYFDLQVENIVYGSTNTAIVSIMTRARMVKGNKGLRMIVSTDSIQYATGEKVLVFLQKTSPGDSKSFRLERNMPYLTIRKIILTDLDDKEDFLNAIEKLADAVNVHGIKRRESIFVDLLSSKNGLIVESAIKELGNMKSEQALGELARLFRDGNQEIRFQVIDAMRQIGGDVAVRIIVSALEDESPRIRSRAASTLGWMGATEVEDQLLRIFLAQDEDENVRVNAVLALGNIGSTKAAPVFVDALNNAKLSKTLRRSIESALRKLQ